MKVIFLDIDYCLNSKEFYKNRCNNKLIKELPYPLDEFDPFCVKLINDILDETKAKLVLYSDWRFTNNIETIFDNVGFKHKIYDITPYGMGKCRGYEIKEWLDKHTDITNYVIIDDDSDMLKEQNEYKKAIGIILYLSQKWEQRAYANGVYQYLINHKYPEHSRLNIKETQLYGGLINLKKSVKLLQSMTEPYQHPFARSVLIILKNNFGIQFEQLIDIGKKTIENIIRILGRTLSKVEYDLSKKEKGEVEFPNYDFINKRFN